MIIRWQWTVGKTAGLRFRVNRAPLGNDGDVGKTAGGVRVRIFAQQKSSSSPAADGDKLPVPTRNRRPAVFANACSYQSLQA